VFHRSTNVCALNVLAESNHQRAQSLAAMQPSNHGACPDGSSGSTSSGAQIFIVLSYATDAMVWLPSAAMSPPMMRPSCPVSVAIRWKVVADQMRQMLS
jgi:hypothetical protein